MITDKEIIKKISDYISRDPRCSPKDGLAEKVGEFMDMLSKFEGQVSGSILEAFKEKTRLDQTGGGEFISNPVGIIDGSGEAFGYDERKRGGTYVEVNLALDCSGSMSTVDGVIYHSRKGHQINELGENNPLFLAPRIFFASLVMRYIHNAFLGGIKSVGASESMRLNGYCFALGQGFDISLYEGQVWMKHYNMGSSTPLLPLIKKFALEENLNGNAQANRLDLIITDGQFNFTDMEEVNKTQFDRVIAGGTLTTVIVNVAPENRSAWALQHAIPQYGIMYHTNSPRQLAQVFQQSLIDLFQQSM